MGRFWWDICGISRAKTCLGRSPGSGGEELGDANKVVGDQVEHEVGAHGRDAPMLGLAHRAVLLTPTEDALDHRPASLGDAIADVTSGALVDGAGPAPAGLVRSIVLRDVRGDIDAAQGAHMISAVIGLVLATVMR